MASPQADTDNLCTCVGARDRQVTELRCVVEKMEKMAMAEVQPGRTGASRDMRSQSRALGAGIVEQISGSCISSVLNKLHGSIAGIPGIAGMAAALLSRVDDQRLVCWWEGGRTRLGREGRGARSSREHGPECTARAIRHPSPRRNPAPPPKRTAEHTRHASVEKNNFVIGHCHLVFLFPYGHFAPSMPYHARNLSDPCCRTPCKEKPSNRIRIHQKPHQAQNNPSRWWSRKRRGRRSGACCP